jgi:hypothetical protein
MVLRTPTPGARPVLPETPVEPLKPVRTQRAGSRRTLLAVAVVTALGGVVAGVLVARGGHDTTTVNAGRATAVTPSAHPVSASPGGSTTPSPAVSASRSAAAPVAVGTPGGSATPSGAVSSAAPSASQAPSPSPSPSASAVATYTVGYQNRVLTIGSDADYQYDLKNGKVEPGGVADWHLSTYGPDYLMSDGTDAYVAKGSTGLTVDQCTAGLDRSPSDSLASEVVAGSRYFCVRSRATGAVVLVHVVKPAGSDGSTTCSLTYYRKDA